MTTPAGLPIAGGPREVLRQRLRALGFDEVRFAAAAGRNSSLRDWLDAGGHADMQWMDRTAEERMDAGLVLSGARSVIILGVNYWNELGERPWLRQAGEIASQPALPIKDPQWARYALHEDYHDTIRTGLAAAGRVLEELHGTTAGDYRYSVDIGPVLERGWAARSGLGFRGKNAMLISQRHGNWLFLATILTRLPIAPDDPLRQSLPPGGDEPAGLLCGKCTRCLEACPTNAFPRPGVVDARRCISYQTIENKGVIPSELRAGIGGRIFGCDICLEVCPWNRFAQQGRQLLLAARPGIAALSLREILGLTPEQFARIFRGTVIKRLKLTGLLRNACVVAGNTGEAGLLPGVLRLTQHASPVVRAHAVWAARRLAGSEAAALLASARTQEMDQTVLAEYAAD